MRSFVIGLILLVPLAFQAAAQKRMKGYEMNFTLVHPQRFLDNYEYSVDPTLEAMCFTSISKSLLISGGLQLQWGTHNWDKYTAYTIYPDIGNPFPLRGMYDRQYRYMSAGIPLKIEKLSKKSFISSVYTQFTAGRYLHIGLKDYYNSLIHTFDINYHGFFWDAQLGITRNILNRQKFSMAFSAMAGVRNQPVDNFQEQDNLAEYLYYGLGLNTRLKK
jgi:hypothetical protein